MQTQHKIMLPPYDDVAFTWLMADTRFDPYVQYNQFYYCI